MTGINVNKAKKEAEASAQFMAFSELSTWEEMCRYDMESDDACAAPETMEVQLWVHRLLKCLLLL